MRSYAPVMEWTSETPSSSMSAFATCSRCPSSHFTRTNAAFMWRPPPDLLPRSPAAARREERPRSGPRRPVAVPVRRHLEPHREPGPSAVRRVPAQERTVGERPALAAQPGELRSRPGVEREVIVTSEQAQEVLGRVGPEASELLERAQERRRREVGVTEALEVERPLRHVAREREEERRPVPRSDRVPVEALGLGRHAGG